MVKRILNFHEEVTHLKLREVCEAYAAHVFAKVRVADVLPIENSGLDDASYRYALQSHFDFIVADEKHSPLFAVEFDGPSHKEMLQRERDSRKNLLCDRFAFPLLRINSRYLDRKYRDMDILTWFVHVWFASKWFEEAQDNGQVAHDEPFMPMAFVSLPGTEKRYPLWLSAVVRGKIQKLHLAGRILDMCPSHVIGVDEGGNYHALAFLRIDDATGVMAETGMRSQRFPVSASEALDEIVTNQVFTNLEYSLENPEYAVPAADIEGRIKEFCAAYKMCRMASFGGSYEIPR